MGTVNGRLQLASALLAIVNADSKSRDRSLSMAFSFSGRLSDSVNTPC